MNTTRNDLPHIRRAYQPRTEFISAPRQSFPYVTGLTARQVAVTQRPDFNRRRIWAAFFLEDETASAFVVGSLVFSLRGVKVESFPVEHLIASNQSAMQAASGRSICPWVKLSTVSPFTTTRTPANAGSPTTNTLVGWQQHSNGTLHAYHIAPFDCDLEADEAVLTFNYVYATVHPFLSIQSWLEP